MFDNLSGQAAVRSTVAPSSFSSSSWAGCCKIYSCSFLLLLLLTLLGRLLLYLQLLHPPPPSPHPPGQAAARSTVAPSSFSSSSWAGCCQIYSCSLLLLLLLLLILLGRLLLDLQLLPPPPPSPNPPGQAAARSTVADARVCFVPDSVQTLYCWSRLPCMFFTFLVAVTFIHIAVIAAADISHILLVLIPQKIGNLQCSQTSGGPVKQI